MVLKSKRGVEVEQAIKFKFISQIRHHLCINKCSWVKKRGSNRVELKRSKPNVSYTTTMEVRFCLFASISASSSV